MTSFPNHGKVDKGCGQQQVQTPSLPLLTIICVSLKKSLVLFVSLPLYSQNEEDHVFLEDNRKKGS